MKTLLESLAKQFSLNASSKLALEAAFSTLASHEKDGWKFEEFAEQLTNWFISERLLPVHVAPKDFHNAITKLQNLNQ